MEFIMGILFFIWMILPFFLIPKVLKNKKKEKEESLSKNLKEEIEALKQEEKDIKVTIQEIKEKSQEEIHSLSQEEESLKIAIQKIQEEYKTELGLDSLFNREKELKLEISKLEKDFSEIQEKDELSSFAFFDKVYDFETAVEYDQAMKANREKQKEMIKSEEAVKGEYNLTFNGSEAQGKKIVKNNVKVVTRAFNGECDACISSVKWNNLETMQNRIGRSYEQINKIAEKLNCQITQDFLKIKLEELKLMQEFLNQKQVEKEEQAELRARMREEEQARQEIEKAEKDALKEEERYSALLAKAELEAKEKTGAQQEAMEAKILLLKEQLAEAQAKKERALSMAQQTKAGHVYVISNIGSFGENVYKIGMTRRLVPEDRVKELSAASVPFNFDIHGMVYSENAVELEKAMHKYLWDNRVNRVNPGREFFSVKFEEISNALREVHGKEFELTKKAKAIEYRQTIAMREAEELEKSQEKIKMDA